MPTDLFKYTFSPPVSFEDIEAGLVHAIMSTESLHGEAQTRLDAAHAVDPEKLTCVIDARTEVGRDLNRLFVGHMRRAYGDDSFVIKRITAAEHAPINKLLHGSPGNGFHSN